MGPYLAAAIQMSSGADRGRNVERARDLVRAAAARGARLVALPEVFAWRGPQDAPEAAGEPVPGPTTTAMAATARDVGVHLVMGSILEAVPGGSRPFNTCCVIGPDGSLLARYRKIHLFEVDLPGRVTVHESDVRSAGGEVVTAGTPLGTLGLSICYDLRFPELYRRLVHAGAEVLVVPSAFTFPTGAAHWEVLCRARAIENQCYLVAPDQTGPNPLGHLDYGESMIVDPWGRVLARAGEGEAVIVAEIDRERLERVRRELPSLTHTRLRD